MTGFSILHLLLLVPQLLLQLQDLPLELEIPLGQLVLLLFNILNLLLQDKPGLPPN